MKSEQRCWALFDYGTILDLPKQQEMSRQIAIEIVSFFFILLFVYAAVSKLLDYQKFTVQLAQSPTLTKHAGLFALSVPTAELVTAVLLIFQQTRFIGLYAAFSLMVVFTAYIIVATIFSDFVPCSCGGVIANLSWSEHLVFNITFTLLGAVAVLLYRECKN